MENLSQIFTNFIQIFLIFLLFLAFFVYMVVSIVDEDENYETYLLQVDEKSYLVVKEKQKLRKDEMW